MRVTVDRESPHYKEEHMGAEVYLNGRRIDCVIEADSDQGHIERYKTDADGHIVTQNDEAQRETLQGNVSIVFPLSVQP